MTSSPAVRAFCRVTGPPTERRNQPSLQILYQTNPTPHLSAGHFRGDTRQVLRDFSGRQRVAAEWCEQALHALHGNASFDVVQERACRVRRCRMTTAIPLSGVSIAIVVVLRFFFFIVVIDAIIGIALRS
jgi:hypothetical protein